MICATAGTRLARLLASKADTPSILIEALVVYLWSFDWISKTSLLIIVRNLLEEGASVLNY